MGRGRVSQDASGRHYTRRGGWRVTYLVVLDGEQHKALGVLLQEGLIGLLGLDGGCHGRLGDFLRLLHDGLLGLDVLGQGGDLGVHGQVLLAGSQVQLLDGRLHAEGLHGRGSLGREGSACGFTRSGRW